MICSHSNRPGEEAVNLQQLEAIACIARNRYNISAAADVLGRSQSGVSRQIKELEIELGTQVFVRTRNKVVGLTQQGEIILSIGQRILRDVRTLEQIGGEESIEAGGEIRVATTHVHARYLLPRTIKAFAERFPATALTLQQCDPQQCRELIAAGEADVGVITLTQKPMDPIVTVPAFRLSRSVIVPVGHPLSRVKRLTIEALAQYPLIAYPASFSGRAIVEETFAKSGLEPRIVCSATDADVCKAYVALGMGVAVLATAAFDAKVDRALVAIDAGHLFRPGILNVVFRKHGYLSRPLESFVSLFAPHVSRELIVRAMDGAEIDRARLGANAPEV